MWQGRQLTFERVDESRIGEVLEVLDEAAGRLAAQGIRQWPARFERGWVEGSVARGETWLVRVDEKVAATVTVDWTDPHWADLGGTAAYVHKLAVRRWAPGLGAVVLDWALAAANGRGVEFLRLDCVRSNARLRSYYEARGFVHRGDVQWMDPSGKQPGDGPVHWQSRYERRVDGQGEETTPTRTSPAVPSNVLGLAPEFTDPLWRTAVRLNPVEAELLRTEPLRRLHFVAHGGASALTTLQSYSRLEHTLGVLALVAHFRPGDEPLRVAALLHDIGHLPLSHTFEGLGGLDHHAIGLELLRTEPIGGVLARHGTGVEEVVGALDGLAGRPGLMNLDHLDSYARSGRSAGRLDADPAALLAGLRLEGGVVSADREGAAVLVGAVCAEARLHTSWDNVGPVSVVRRLAGRLLDAPDGPAAAEVARMTDQQLWSALDAYEATAAESRRIRYEAHRLGVEPGRGDGPGWDFSLRRIYSSAPLVDGRPVEEEAPELAAQLEELRLLPTNFRVRWRR
ncbi:GNAT family N-acetyltransferase [Kitasatospora sp. NPDC051170]|uniref:GNAT family N-acetyltransferase n=1 Tax=Kitasatospora sp. NPDC051170 TaxID=3364056 RepID=UPI0037B5664A